MFQQFKNIDTAFRFVRLFALMFLLATVVICLFVIQRTTAVLQKGQQKIYVLSGSQLLAATGIERGDSIAVEVRDHIKNFHFLFYSLQPDDDVIKRHVNAALYLADNSARQEYNNLLEMGWYNNMITANASQEVLDYDSIKVDISHMPYYFQYFGKLKITRPTSILTRSLISEGYVRVLANGISDHNPHGMMIERWKVLDNRDLTVEKR